MTNILKHCVHVGRGLAMLGTALLGAVGTADARDTGPPAAPSGPIHLTFVIHLDPLFAPRGEVLRRSYEAERDNLAWLADYLDRLEKEKGKEFVPRLTLEMAGDHAEWYLGDEKGLTLLKRLYQKGIHSLGTHFHTNYREGEHLWPAMPHDWLSPQTARRVTQDHVAEVDKLVAKVIGTDDPKAVRKANRTITGHFIDQRLAEQMGFDVQTGGRNEAMNLFFDHDVYNPWRPALRWNLGEDPSSRWLLIPQAPVPGVIGEHAPIPRGVPEEYTRGMRNMIWQDLSVPALKRKFLHLYLEWQSSLSPKVWVFGWHEHTGDLFADDSPTRVPRRLREPLVQYVEWLGARFVGKKTRDGRLVAKYSTTDEVRDEFLVWEKAHPGQSSFNYPVQVRDWQEYPYRLKGLARELMYSHYVQQLDTFRDQGVDLHQLVRTDGRNWYLRDGKIACDGETENIHVLWADKDGTRVDLSPIIKGPLRVVAGASGSQSTADSEQLVVHREPIVVLAGAPVAPAAVRGSPDAAQGPTEGLRSSRRPSVKPSAGSGDPRRARMPIQFRMNVNYVPDEALARENCRVLRRHLELFKQAGVKASYWFTGLAADQIQRVDPEFLRLLGEAGMPVAHHGANRPPNPQPIHRVKGKNWDDDVRAIVDYESYAIDPRTGKLDKTRAGGLKRMQEMFGNRVHTTGRFFQASILCATKQLGCHSMIGLKDNTGAKTNAGWFLGMMGMPDSRSIGPEMLRAAATGRLDLHRFIEDSESQPTNQEVQSIAVLTHDYDFWRGRRELRQPFWESYADLVHWAAKHPRLTVVTFQDILNEIADDRTKSVSRQALVKAAEAVAASQTAPPEYIDLGGDHLSLADAFQAFAQALTRVAEGGNLPDSVQAVDLLGPTQYHASGLPTVIAAVLLPKVTGGEVVGAAKRVSPALRDRIPTKVAVGRHDLNPAEFLLAMGQTILAIAKAGKPEPVSLHAVDLLPPAVRENRLADPLTKLQFWTFKPQRKRAD